MRTLHTIRGSGFWVSNFKIMHRPLCLGLFLSLNPSFLVLSQVCVYVCGVGGYIIGGLVVPLFLPRFIVSSLSHSPCNDAKRFIWTQSLRSGSDSGAWSRSRLKRLFRPSQWLFLILCFSTPCHYHPQLEPINYIKAKSKMFLFLGEKQHIDSFFEPHFLLWPRYVCIFVASSFHYLQIHYSAHIRHAPCTVHPHPNSD